jgi:hypothetical protein
LVCSHAGKLRFNSKAFQNANSTNSAESISKSSSGFINAIQFRLLQLFIVVALILCIVGGTSSYSSTGVYQPQVTTKAGVVMYFVALVALTVIAFVSVLKLSHGPSEGRKLAWVVIIALPFILVRIAYSIISVFSHNRHFNILTGSVAIHVVMAILEEMAVVILYIAVGWTMDSLPPNNSPPASRRSRRGNSNGRGGAQGNNDIEVAHVRNGGGAAQVDNGGYATYGGNQGDVPQGSNGGYDTYGGNQGGVPQGNNGRGRPPVADKKRRRRGPIHALVGAGIDAVQQRREDKAAANGP